MSNQLTLVRSVSPTAIFTQISLEQE